MEILRYAFRLPPNLGGMENHISTLSHKQRKKYNITIFYMFGNPIKSKNITYVKNKFSFHTTKNSLNRVLNSVIFSFLILKKTFLRHKFIVHIHGDYIDSFIPSKLIQIFRIPSVLTIHASGPRSVIIDYISKITYTYIDHIFVLSYHILNALLTIGIPKNKIKILTSGYDYDKFQDLHQYQMDTSSVHKKILFVGRLVDWKKPDLVIDAFKYFLKTSNSKFEYQLIIIGDGPLYKPLKSNNNSPSIIFKGRLSKRSTIKEMINSSLIIIPSIRSKKTGEATPTVAIEALFANIPIISTKTHGLYYYHNLFNGIQWVSENSVDDIIKSMNNVFSTPSKFIINNSLKAKEIFDWNVVTEAYNIIFDNLPSKKYNK